MYNFTKIKFNDDLSMCKFDMGSIISPWFKITYATSKQDGAIVLEGFTIYREKVIPVIHKYTSEKISNAYYPQCN
jgi:hypothetical protein